MAVGTIGLILERGSNKWDTAEVFNQNSCTQEAQGQRETDTSRAVHLSAVCKRHPTNHNQVPL